MRKVSATRDHRLLAETMFEYLAETDGSGCDGDI